MLLRDKDILTKAQNDRDYMDYLMRTQEAEKFIKYVIKSFTKNPALFMQQHRVEWEDLYQASFIGLFSGIKKLDLEKSPNEWVRYLYLSVQGEIRNFSRSNNSNLIGVSQRIREMYPEYTLYYHFYWDKFQQDPSIDETMKEMNISRDDAFSLVYGMQQVISIFQYSRGKYGNITIGHLIRDPFTNVEKTAINNVLIEKYASCLSSKQKNVIYMYYYLGFNKTEIGKIIGCGSYMVQRHIENAFNKIRK